MWGDWSYVSTHNLSLMRSFPRSIAAFLTVVYSTSDNVVMKGKRRHRKARLSTMKMRVDAIRVFVWMWRYTASISILPIRMVLDGHLIFTAAIIWIIMKG